MDKFFSIDFLKFDCLFLRTVELHQITIFQLIKNSEVWMREKRERKKESERERERERGGGKRENVRLVFG